MEYLLLLFFLNVKHWYADFCIQTYDQTIKKGSYGDLVGVSHSLDHMLYTIIALVAFNLIHPINPLIILFVSIFEGIAHYHIDYLKVKYGTKDQQTSRYWSEFGADQLAHQVTYLFIAYFILKYT